MGSVSMTPCACFACVDCAELYEQALALVQPREDAGRFVDSEGVEWPW